MTTPTAPIGPAAPDGMQRPVTIAVAGTHSTGKTTFLARLAHRLRQRHLEVATVADLGEQALRTGLGILHSHTYASTLWIMARGISHEVATWPHVDVLLVDRPVPDALGYYLAALDHRGESPDPVALGHLRTLAAQHSCHYDLTFRTTLDPTAPLGTDKPRDTDSRYRRLADHHVGQVLVELAIPHRLLPAHGHDSAITHATDFALDQLGAARQRSDHDTDHDTDYDRPKPANSAPASSSRTSG
ncbi:AAA family ATPase [Pseudonocardia lacus]|uniref:AAA family ATPase n=1 Tax=Pseudonocardia lacus TaxID=2835865 RepID=UPI001BDCB279|nr:AAA family ATPase [Pseudonocardia lacus]